MTNDKLHPCLERLDADCFRVHPVWAKQAFAYRLVHLLTPKALTKRLPKGLRRALLAPGVVIPPGVEVPGGFILGPGADLPADWVPWGLPEEAVTPPPVLPPGVEETGPTPPIYTGLGEAGPINQPGRLSPAGKTAIITGSTNDGWVRNRGTSWNAAHDAATGYSNNRTATADNRGTYVNVTGSYRWIYRSFFFFNLSSIPAGSTVKSAELTLGGWWVADNEVSIQRGTQGDSVGNADFDAYIDPYFDVVTWRISGASGTNLNRFTFNAAGRAYIESVCGGTARLCAREYPHDYNDVDPGSGDVTYANGIYYAEWSVAALRPTLIVKY